jgi:hypothetical protein
MRGTAGVRAGGNVRQSIPPFSIGSQYIVPPGLLTAMGLPGSRWARSLRILDACARGP